MVRYVFREAAPREACRPYTDEEWARLVASIITPAVQATTNHPPTAIFITGLPGGGKSKSLDLIFNSVCAHLPPKESFAIVDFDHMRSFHEQYVFHSNESNPEDPSRLHSFYGLVPWFLEGTDFENTVFKASPTRGLFPLILANKYSFVMEAVLDSSRNFNFVQYVASRGYAIIFAYVYTPLEKAIQRAESRAYQTGRWSSREFITSRHAGLVEWFAPIARFVLHESARGTVALFDNSQDGKDLDLIYQATSSSIPLSPPAYPPWDSFSLLTLTSSTPNEEILHLSRNRLHNLVISFAMSEITDIFSQVLSSPISTSLALVKLPEKEIIAYSNVDSSISFCLAGECFKKIITKKETRAMEVWPCSEADKEKLFQILNNSQNATIMEDNLLNVLYKVGTVKLDIAKECSPADLKEKLEKFDIALRAVGVQFLLTLKEGSWNLCVTGVYVHRDWIRSLELRKPLLVARPNSPYILATAERVIRYASELGWPVPKSQLDYLLGHWKQAIESEKVVQNSLEEFRCATQDKKAKAFVCEMFDIKI